MRKAEHEGAVRQSKGEYKVAVVAIGRLRKYMENAPAAQVDISAVRQELGI